MIFLRCYLYWSASLWLACQCRDKNSAHGIELWHLSHVRVTDSRSQSGLRCSMAIPQGLGIDRHLLDYYVCSFWHLPDEPSPGCSGRDSHVTIGCLVWEGLDWFLAHYEFSNFSRFHRFGFRLDSEWVHARDSAWCTIPANDNGLRQSEGVHFELYLRKLDCVEDKSRVPHLQTWLSCCAEFFRLWFIFWCDIF